MDNFRTYAGKYIDYDSHVVQFTYRSSAKKGSRRNRDDARRAVMQRTGAPGYLVTVFDIQLRK